MCLFSLLQAHTSLTFLADCIFLFRVFFFWFFLMHFKITKSTMKTKIKSICIAEQSFVAVSNSTMNDSISTVGSARENRFSDSKSIYILGDSYQTRCVHNEIHRSEYECTSPMSYDINAMSYDICHMTLVRWGLGTRLHACPIRP